MTKPALSSKHQRLRDVKSAVDLVRDDLQAACPKADPQLVDVVSELVVSSEQLMTRFRVWYDSGRMPPQAEFERALHTLAGLQARTVKGLWLLGPGTRPSLAEFAAAHHVEFTDAAMSRYWQPKGSS